MPNAELEVRTYGAGARPRMGFFTDTSLCIGCKACEVACKEWNHVPDDITPWTGQSHDNTRALGADTWRHVAFIEQKVPVGADGAARSLVQSAAAEGLAEHAGLDTYQEGDGLRWLMASDVCKHCTDAACLDVCPTGALFRTEYGTVVVQEDVCNGCGYCVPACPFGVLDQREGDGRVWKCTLCYDRLRDDMEPACAQACPTDALVFGNWQDPTSRINALAHSRDYRLLSHLGTNPSVVYLKAVDSSPPPASNAGPPPSASARPSSAYGTTATEGSPAGSSAGPRIESEGRWLGAA